VIASTDLTHYGANFDYTPFKTDLEANLTKLDMGIINLITRLDFDDYFEYRRKTGITMCGFAPVGVLMEMFADKAHKATLIDYYKSGDRNKDYTLSVSYASIIISETKGGKKNMTDTAIKEDESPAKLTKQEQTVLLRIARDTLDQYLENGALEKDLEKKYEISANLKVSAGVFVTLREKGDLRGCIGSIVGAEPLYLGVQGNAVKSAVRDPRFSPVKKAELEDIDIEISVMTPLQPLDDYKKIRLGTDGVIIKKGYYQAVYLPQVATETGWNLGQFLGSLCQKAGLPSDSYLPSQNKGDEKMEFLIFQAQVFGEK
jgi:AmmeMemoRadiSam system protein A